LHKARRRGGDISPDGILAAVEHLNERIIGPIRERLIQALPPSRCD